MRKEILIAPAYAALITSEKRYKRLQGGGGSGKSIAVAKHILGRVSSQQGARAFVFRKVGRTVRDSVFKTFQDLISEHEIGKFYTVNRSTYTIRCEITGSEIICGGIDDPEKIKSIKDPTIIWMEEATEFNRADFMQLDLRLRKPGALLEFLLTYNPISKANWIYETFEVGRQYSGDELYLKTTYKDNPYLPDQYIKVLESLVNRSPEDYKVYALGEWGEVLDGVIFTDYEIVEDWPDDGNNIYGLDFGFSDPMALVELCIAGGDLYVKELIYKSGLTVPELIAKLPGYGLGVKDWIYYDSASPGSGQQIYNAGYRLATPAQKGKDSIQAGIDKVKEYNLKISAKSVNLLRELKSYRWAKDKEGQFVDGVPIDVNNHLIDAMRYAIFTHTYKAKQTGGFISNVPRKERYRR